MADGTIVPEPQPDESEHEWSDDEDDYFPIHHAAVAGDIEEIRRLLLAGVSPDEETTYQEGEEPPTLTPICILCGKYGYFGTCENRIAGVKLLLAAGASPRPPALNYAVGFGKYELVQMLLDAGADVHNAEPFFNYTGTLLFRAIHGSDRPDSELWPRDAYPIVKALLAAGARFDIKHEHRSPLDKAIENQKRRLYPLFLRAGAAIHSYIDISAEPYLRNVHRAGGWKRYEQAHIARLAPVFAKIFPRPRLPQELVAQVLRFCFHTGFY